MYKAKIKNKEDLQHGVRVTVTFSDGTNSFDEIIEPQTKAQFHSWVEGRLFTLNEQEAMKADLAVERPAEPVDQAVVDKQEWFKQYNKLEQLEKLEAKNFLTGKKLAALNKQLADTRAFLDANIKVEYLSDL